MNIVHIAPNAVFTDGWTYQENLLLKYQMKLGHTVTLLTRNHAFVDGKETEVPCSDEICSGGFRVIRLKKKSPFGDRSINLFSFLDVYALLLELKPDMVFVHGMVSATIFQVAKYKRKVNKNLVIVQDNHMDYNNIETKSSLTGRISALTYRAYYKMNDKYIDRVYGVTPRRREYAIKVYGVPEEKTDVLIMGADDEKIQFDRKAEIRSEIRKKYGIPDDAFLIVTGGKIDRVKNIHLLMKAIEPYESAHLLIFGMVLDDMREEFDALLAANSRISYAGWISGDQVYDYFFAGDLVCFPGLHSVLWEQACAAKVPCLFTYLEGMTHVNNGGNAAFLETVNLENLQKMIGELLFTQRYYEMKRAAESEKTDIYLYSGIAKKTLELLERRA